MATQYTAGLTTGQVLTAATMNSIGAAWESYTPTLVQGATTVTKTVTYAKYTQINKLCICNVRLDVTGTGTAGSSLTMGLPLTASTTTIRIGSGEIYDSSTSTTYDGMCYLLTTTSIVLRGDWAAANDWGVVPSIAIAANDQVNFSVMYEVA